MILPLGLLLCALPVARADPPAAPTSAPSTDVPPKPEAPAGPAGNDALLHVQYQQYTWQRNDAPVKMIAKDEGFCFLSEVAGHFAGGGEKVSVYVGDDGFWYLGGHADQGLWAKAYSIKFPHKIVADVVTPPDPADAAWHDATAVLTREGDNASRELLARELAAMPSDADGMMKLADDWKQTNETLAVKHQRLIEPHVVRLYHLAINKLSGAPREAAVSRLRAVDLALAQGRLNDLGAWHVNGGDWSTLPDGRIQGRGNSEIVLINKLPPDCSIKFHVMPVDGMRTRVKFGGTNLFVGNEGYTHHIEAYGAQMQRGVPFPYVEGDDMKLAIKFSGNDFEFYINDQLAAKGTRKTIPDEMSFSLSAGDDWDGGTTQFWGLTIAADK